jgi:hypothetical protein
MLSSTDRAGRAGEALLLLASLFAKGTPSRKTTVDLGHFEREKLNATTRFDNGRVFRKLLTKNVTGRRVDAEVDNRPV